MVTLRDVNEDVDKGCIRYKKLPTTQVENLHAASHFTQHKTFSALNYAQDFGNRVKESLKRTTNLKWTTLTNCPMSNTFMSLLALSTMSLPLMQTMTKEDEIGIGVDWIENFRPLWQRTIRSESTQDEEGSLAPASWDYVMPFAIFLKS